jgi:hypothetical protein
VERTYAATLGLLAFVTAIARGWLAGGGVSDTLLTAWLALLAFTAVGGMLGWLAGWIVDDAVRTRMAEELDKKL